MRAASTSAAELGLAPEFYREAVLCCREMRNRFSFLDIAVIPGFLRTLSGGGLSLRPLAELTDEAAARVGLVLTDIDDTMTYEGRLPAEAYRALEDLYNSGFRVAPITGRPPAGAT